MACHDRPREIIDLTVSDDGLFDDDVVFLDTPPRNMKKWNNASRPIDVDGEPEPGALQRFTSEENEWRRMLMMEHDVLEEKRPKRKAQDGLKARRHAEGRLAGVASESGQREGAEGEAGPSNLMASSFHDRLEAAGSGREVGPVKRAKRGRLVTGSKPEETPPITTTNQTEGPTASTSESPSLDNLVSHLLAIIPDMCPAHASKSIEALLAFGQSAIAIETVVTKALEEGYPRPTKRAPVVGMEECYAGKVYRAEERRGFSYQSLSNAALEEAFPFVPVPYIRAVQNRHSFLFGPTYLQLIQDDLEVVKPFTILKRPRPAGKGKLGMPEMDEGGVEFELEKNWILAHAAGMRVDRDAAIAKKLADEAEWAAGGGIECGCCFGDYLPGDMFQCLDGHLFCKDCCVGHTGNKLGDEIHVILCMDTSGCTARFDEKELARFLPSKSLELLQRLRFAQELEDAAIEGLETCPSCPWAVVIDNPDEKLFRCMNEDCGKVFCRQCRKVEHLPKSCQEHAESTKANKRHAVEDAMSEALIRKCPNCQKPYIKESGCNKILCVKCGSYSCYICQKTIKGYDHFTMVPKPNEPATQCNLWDRDEAHNDAANVVRARDAAVVAQQQRAAVEGIVIDAVDLAVDGPVIPPRVGPGDPGRNPAGLARMPPPDPFVPLDHLVQLELIRQRIDGLAQRRALPGHNLEDPAREHQAMEEFAREQQMGLALRNRIRDLRAQGNEQPAQELERRAEIAEWALRAREEGFDGGFRG